MTCRALAERAAVARRGRAGQPGDSGWAHTAALVWALARPRAQEWGRLASPRAQESGRLALPRPREQAEARVSVRPRVSAQARERALEQAPREADPTGTPRQPAPKREPRRASTRARRSPQAKSESDKPCG
jgi:hypothetical protein